MTLVSYITLWGFLDLYKRGIEDNHWNSFVSFNSLIIYEISKEFDVFHQIVSQWVQPRVEVPELKEDKICMAPALMEFFSYVGNGFKQTNKIHNYVSPTVSASKEKFFKTISFS